MSTYYFFHRISLPSPVSVTESIMFSMFLKGKLQIQLVEIANITCTASESMFCAPDTLLQSHTSIKWRIYQWPLVKSLTDFIVLKENSKAKWRIKSKFPGLNSAVSSCSIDYFQSSVAKKDGIYTTTISSLEHNHGLFWARQSVWGKKRYTEDAHYQCINRD